MENFKDAFIEWYSRNFISSDHEYVTAMKQTVENSPYHREKNVAVHTDMVVNEYIKQTPETWSREDLLGAIVATFHDVGKPKTQKREYSSKYKKVVNRYNNHEEYSANMWIDFWSKDEMNIKSIVSDKIEAYNIAVMIAYHLPYNLGSQKIKMLRTHLYRFNLGSVFGKILIADSRGRISDATVEPRNVDWYIDYGFADKVLDTFPLSSVTDVHVMVGAPGSGKSTYCRNYSETDVIYSFDSIREDSFPEFSTYHEKFTAFNSYDFDNDKTLHHKYGVPESINTQSHFLDYLMVEGKKSVKSNGIFVIDNTNTNRKSRRKLKNSISCNGMKAVYFIGPFSKIIENNKTREHYKAIPMDVLKRMYFLCVPPLFGEFDDIEIVETMTN